MHPIILRRTSVSKAHTMLLSSPRTPLHLHPAIARSPSHALQARSLWWFSRHGSEWSNPDEGLDERMQRYQKIMKHRYSKALRRRAIWDRDTASRGAWGWRLPSRWMGSRWADYKDLSSWRPLQADVHDREHREKAEKENKERRPWDEWEAKWNRDFETFRSAVDKAIDRDPYGTLFGRHLRSPPSKNNSSWTSFAWIFEPAKGQAEGSNKGEGESVKKTESKVENAEEKKAMMSYFENRAEKSERSQSNIKATFSVPPRSPTTVVKNQTLAAEDEYEYDPISMRKVLKTNPEAPPPAAQEPAPQKPFLSSLFSEHGVDIPVKTYKPHKVYGYGSTTTAKSDASQKAEAEKLKPSTKGFESSRLQELKALKAVTLGTNIDTTAEYGGKYRAKDDASLPSEQEAAERRREELEKRKEGLEKWKQELEGRTPRAPDAQDDAPLFSGTTYESKSEEILAAKKTKSDWLLNEGFRTMDEALRPKPSTVAETRPAVTRTETGETSGRLESSLDRMYAKQVDSSETSAKKPLENAFEANLKNDKVEDVDLLRASDVRAAARTARKTKLEAEQSKMEARQRLENDYSSRVKAPNEEVPEAFSDRVAETSSKISKSLTNVWKHVREYPQGIVAKTMQSMGMFNSSYKNYVRLDRPAVDSTEKLVFKDEALSKTPSIYKNPKAGKPMKAFTPSKEVLDAERQSVARTAALVKANEDAKEKAALESAQTAQLAAEIRKEYESQYGTIDANHRQVDTASPAVQADPQATPVEKKPHPLKTATVKPGVERDWEIEHHVNVFEPKFAELVQEMKQARHNLHQISQHIKAIKSQRPQTYWNSKPTAESTVLPEVAALPKSTDIVDKAGNSLLSMTPLPTYIFLAYDPATDRVDASRMSSRFFALMPSRDRSQDLADALVQLKMPAKYSAEMTTLLENGYELVRGGTDSIVFKRVEEAPPAQDEASKTPLPAEEAPKTLSAEKQNQVAAEEAAAQPVDTRSANGMGDAATVVDEIPQEVGASAAPAAPTAPPTTTRYGSHGRRAIRRQEPVFSGQKTVSADQEKASQELKNSEPEASSEPAENVDELWQEVRKEQRVQELDRQAKRKERIRELEADLAKSQNEKRQGFWARLGRGVRRVVLTGLAMAGFAYAVGAVAEGVGAGREGKRVRDGQVRVVGRPGIYSTENSR